MEQSMPFFVSRLNLQAVFTFRDSVGKAIILPDSLALFVGGEDGHIEVWSVALTRDKEYMDPNSS